MTEPQATASSGCPPAAGPATPPVARLPATTYKEYVLNMDEKMQNPEFLGDTTDLLRPKLEYNPQAAWERVRDEIVAKLLPSK